MPTCLLREGEMRLVKALIPGSEAQDDSQKISSMRYVAGAMTYKVNEMPDTNFYFNL